MHNLQPTWALDTSLELSMSLTPLHWSFKLPSYASSFGLPAWMSLIPPAFVSFIASVIIRYWRHVCLHLKGGSLISLPTSPPVNLKCFAHQHKSPIPICRKPWNEDHLIGTGAQGDMIRDDKKREWFKELHAKCATGKGLVRRLGACCRCREEIDVWGEVDTKYWDWCPRLSTWLLPAFLIIVEVRASCWSPEIMP